MRILFVVLLMVAFPVCAQEQGALVEVDEQFQSFVDAIEIAAQVDAYNGYCGKETQVANDLVERATLADVMVGGGDALRDFAQEHYIYFAKELKKEGVDCKDVEFLFEKLEVFKKMKILLKRINGDDNVEVGG